MGEPEPERREPTIPEPPEHGESPRAPETPATGETPETAETPAAGPPPRQGGRSMSAGRVITLVIGSIVALVSLAVLAAGVTALVFDRTQRDSDDYLVTDSVQLDSGSYAVVASTSQIDTDAPDWSQVGSITGDVQVRAEGDDAVFLGLARESAVDEYLADLDYDEVSRIDDGDVSYEAHRGGPPPGPPDEQDFWTDSASGSGQQRLTFEPEDGRWVVVAMNADGSRGIDMTARVGAELPILLWISIGVTIAGVIGLIVAAILIYIAVRHLGTPREVT